jgi:hypothetical protein
MIHAIAVQVLCTLVCIVTSGTAVYILVSFYKVKFIGIRDRAIQGRQKELGKVFQLSPLQQQQQEQQQHHQQIGIAPMDDGQSNV